MEFSGLRSGYESTSRHQAYRNRISDIRSITSASCTNPRQDCATQVRIQVTLPGV